MTNEQAGLIDSIRGLARAAQRDTGLYVAFGEHLHKGGAVDLEASIQVGDGFRWWRGSSNPIKGHQVTLEAMREQMIEWLVEQRKEAA